jgi:tetratricopeptide (TPR) repeat protein
LVSDLEKDGHPISVTRDETDNEAQLARIHVPAYKSIKPVSAEPVVLDHYANIPYRIGQAYALAGQKDQAISWYRKALAMDPSLTLPAKAIERLGGTP